MSEKKQLKRYKQCEKCPWKVSTDPHDIPGGYSVKKHEALKRTVADPNDVRFDVGEMHAMACHESMPGEEMHCVGWLHNQLGVGNNLALRFDLMVNYEMKERLQVFGEQHERFEDTLPKKGKRRANKARVAQAKP